MKKKNSPYPRAAIHASATLFFALPALTLAGLAPYTPDAATLHLWHLDEATPGTIPAFTTSDSVSPAGAVTLDVKSGAKLAAPAMTAGLGGALDTRGIPGSGQGPGAFGPEDLPLSEFRGLDGAFTLEALINLGFDPTQPTIATRIDALQLVSLDNEGANGVRPFQWRILPTNHAENTSGFWAIEFLNIAPAAGIERFQLPLPDTGPNLLAAGAWYHVALTFNGQANTADNLSFYWTRLGQGAQSAQLLGTSTMVALLGDGVTTTPGDFSIGNIGRGTPANNFVGLIDEVRVSSTARAPGQFNLNGTPYTLDVGTLHLYHFDEPNPPNFPPSVQTFATDAVASDGLNLASLANGATFGNASLAGFNTALRTFDSGLTGSPASTDAVLSALAPVNAAGDNVVFTYADPNTGAFTFEALVRLDVDLTQSFTGTTRGVGFMHIVSGEQDGAGGGVRAWQFRIDPIGSSPNADGFTGPLTEPVIEFINVNGGVAPVQNRIIPLPTTGPNAVAQGEWYHVAAAYSGEEDIPDNLSIYWTKIDASRTQAELLGTKTLNTDLPLAGAGVDFTIGNIGRTTPNGNFLGLIDEVRLSSVARGPTDFGFTNATPLVVPEIIGFTADLAANRTMLTWRSQPSQTYKVQRSADLVAWTTLASNLPGQATQTSFTDTLSPPVPSLRFYRVLTPEIEVSGLVIAGGWA